MSDKLLLPISIVLAGALVGAGFYLKGKNTAEINNVNNNDNVPGQNQARPQSEDLLSIIRKVDANDHVLGNPDARVVIVEYSDTECAFCKMFHSTMISLMDEYGKDGSLAWVYRHFPIAELHSNAPKQAEAQECASEIGGNSKFWDFTNKIYEVTPSNNGLPYSELSKIASDVGLPVSAFNTCLESGQYAPRVEMDIINAKELGALGTPYSVLIDTKTGEHYPIEGAYPYSQIKSVIDIILAS